MHHTAAVLLLYISKFDAWFFHFKSQAAEHTVPCGDTGQAGTPVQNKRLTRRILYE